MSGRWLGLLGDALAQHVEKKSLGSLTEHFDLERSSAFTIYSCCWGAFGLRPWLNFLNRNFPGSSWQAICQKVVMQQLAWNPTVYLPTFYGFNGLYRGQDVDALIAKVRSEYVSCLLYIWKVWIPMSIGIFAFVPARHQVAANFLGNLLWNTLLSLFYNERRIE
ncbi:PXMP2/4 family protein 1 [Durusdinium trenchii]|uniref:PXMP2/4 family protein 1 n=1 Tax=Durusdinium trenchii TaxID=1381693 RepID=A0ABP0RST7_9DINO|eukprot:g5037.t2